MRVALLGKGGSGKTTIAAGLVRALTSDTEPVLAIDGDHNVHLGEVLGIESRPLHAHADEIARRLEPRLSQVSPVIGMTPPSGDARFVRVARDDPFLRDWATWSQDERVALLTVGTYQPEDAGSHCYHVKLEVAQMVLHRTLDSARERIVWDSTAGSDPVGTSMFFASDCNIVVVEPTSRSIAVYEGIRRIGQRCGLRTFVIANKVADADDATFVRQAVPDEDLVGEVRVSASLRRLDRGVDGALDEFVAENADLWAAIRRLHAGEEWDWDAYLGRLRRAFADNCAWWYDAYYSRSLAEDIDQTFRYSNVIRPAMSAS